jgi:hypothetical protein
MQPGSMASSAPLLLLVGLIPLAVHSPATGGRTSPRRSPVRLLPTPRPRIRERPGVRNRL